MKRIINGFEGDLEPIDGIEIAELPDRMIVRTAVGAYSAVALRIGDAVHISYRGRTYAVGKAGASRRAHSGTESGEIRASMPGQIVDVFVEEGTAVKAGEKLVVLEAMKTQQAFAAPFDGTVKQVRAAKGRQVAEEDLLVLVEPSAGAEPKPS